MFLLFRASRASRQTLFAPAPCGAIAMNIGKTGGFDNIFFHQKWTTQAIGN
jgi:hypothetical protein